mmetsp:Transcript_19571/g.60794  ORF Transcript_19571/g.60794 Transcript_19571/m.60794 type:complete len:278 (-) Transcript_19571:227-1060(-)
MSADARKADAASLPATAAVHPGSNSGACTWPGNESRAATTASAAPTPAPAALAADTAATSSAAATAASSFSIAPPATRPAIALSSAAASAAAIAGVAISSSKCTGALSAADAAGTAASPISRVLRAEDRSSERAARPRNAANRLTAAGRLNAAGEGDISASASSTTFLALGNGEAWAEATVTAAVSCASRPSVWLCAGQVAATFFADALPASGGAPVALSPSSGSSGSVVGADAGSSAVDGSSTGSTSSRLRRTFSAEPAAWMRKLAYRLCPPSMRA